MSRTWRSLPVLLLGVLTLATLGAPLALWIWLALGGKPDRSTAWVAFWASTALVALLMAATIAASLARQRAERRAKSVARQESEAR